MKVFAMLGLVALASAENDNDKIVQRRRLALSQCTFADNVDGAHSPNYMGTYTWDITEATGEPGTHELAKHRYKCCTEKHPGALQANCADASSTFCVGAATDDQDADDADEATTTFFSVGYTVADGACTTDSYADNCRDHVQCDSDNGYSGTADLTCAADSNGDFSLRGCARGDVGTVGVDQTRDVYIVATNTAPTAGSNAKNSFAQCVAAAQHHDTDGFTSGNGGCNLGGLTCNPAYICGVMPSWDGVLEVSDDDDTFVKAALFKSQQNERCITITSADGIPTGLELEGDCGPNVASNDDTATYGGFDLYGNRFSCWRNQGGGVTATANNKMQQFDLTVEVFGSSVNAGIGQTLYDIHGEDIDDYIGVWNGGAAANAKGWGVCNGVDVSLDGCTAELAALMCQAYNRKLIEDGTATTRVGGESTFCAGFQLSDKKVGLGKSGAKQYPTDDTDYDMFVGFFSAGAGDVQYQSDDNYDGGYFKYVPVANCLITSTVSCSQCERCEDGFVMTSKFQCELDCPDYQYSNNGVCTYRAAHCLTGSDDGATCNTCHADFFVNDDGICEETGCVVPDPMLSPLLDVLVGAEQSGAPACTAGGNIVPGSGGCGIDCPAGTYSSVPGNSHVYGCDVKGDPDEPDIVCTACTTTDCASCPSDVCDVCDNGYELTPVLGGGFTCEPVACPTPAVQVDYTFVATGIAGTNGIAAPLFFGVFHQGLEHCLALVLADGRCAGDYFSYKAGGDGDCGCKESGGTEALAVTADATVNYYSIGADDAAGSCLSCPQGTAGTLGWLAVDEDWDTSPSHCTACAVSNCLDCKGNADECLICADGYHVTDANKLACQQIGYCPYGTVGTVTWNQDAGADDTSQCIADTNTCEDSSQEAGSCTDCADGYAGSVDWDAVNGVWNTDQCHAVACPLETDTPPNCVSCPAFHTPGTPTWDDLFNEWVGCVANEFGFSGPSAAWEGGVSADRYMIETKTAESLHVSNAQYDAIKEEWVCDEGYGGEGCKQRLCPETVAFTSGTDGFTPSQSMGDSFSTDAAMGTSSTFSNQHSYKECGGRGTCDFETGICQCFPGFTGVGCRRTTCPNGCSGHGTCMNDDISNYHAAGDSNLPSDDVDINTWGNLWASDKFQGCRCDGGWGGNDCSLRQCPRGDDPETQCADDLGNDRQTIECRNVYAQNDHFFKLRFTDQLGNRYNTRAIVIRPHDPAVDEDNAATVGPAYTRAAAHSIQTALESLPNFAIPRVEVTSDTEVPNYWSGIVQTGCTPTKNNPTKGCVDEFITDYAAWYTLKFEVHFTAGRNSGKQSLLEAVTNVKCDSGVQPKFDNTTLTCEVRRETNVIDYRENAECSNRGLCNRKTAECNCFDGYTGLACDIIAQTY